jgi:hypothetical protein
MLFKVHLSILGEEYKAEFMEGGGIKHCLPFPGITGPPPLMDDIFPGPMLILPHVIDSLSYI